MKDKEILILAAIVGGGVLLMSKSGGGNPLQSIIDNLSSFFGSLGGGSSPTNNISALNPTDVVAGSGIIGADKTPQSINSSQMVNTSNQAETAALDLYASQGIVSLGVTYSGMASPTQTGIPTGTAGTVVVPFTQPVYYDAQGTPHLV